MGDTDSRFTVTVVDREADDMFFAEVESMAEAAHFLLGQEVGEGAPAGMNGAKRKRSLRNGPNRTLCAACRKPLKRGRKIFCTDKCSHSAEAARWRSKQRERKQRAEATAEAT